MVRAIALVHPAASRAASALAQRRSLVQSGQVRVAARKEVSCVDDPEAALLHPPGGAGVRRDPSLLPVVHAGSAEVDRRESASS